MVKYFIVSIVTGVLFGILDGIINGTPLAQRLYEVFKPISREKINIPVGIIIDVVYGFVLAGLFVLLSASLPGSTGVIKGVAFGIIVWFLRVVMYGVSQWMMYKVPCKTVVYMVLSGLLEMLILGLIIGILLGN
jgi:hypothetical protein